MYEIISETVSEDGKTLTAVIRTDGGSACIMSIPLRSHGEDMNLWGNDFLEACFRAVFPDADLDGLYLTLEI